MAIPVEAVPGDTAEAEAIQAVILEAVQAEAGIKIRVIPPGSAAAQLCSMPWALWAIPMYGEEKTPIPGLTAVGLPAMCMHILASVSPVTPIPSVLWEKKSVMPMPRRGI